MNDVFWSCRKVDFLMKGLFAKAVLRAEKRGVRPAQAYTRAKNRLDRWIHGDKEGLWREVMEESRARQGKKRKGGRSQQATEEAVTRNAGLGRIAKAVRTFLSPGGGRHAKGRTGDEG